MAIAGHDHHMRAVGRFAFVHRTANTQVSDLRFLPVLEASIVIEALKSMLDRAKAKPQPTE